MTLNSRLRVLSNVYRVNIEHRCVCVCFSIGISETTRWYYGALLLRKIISASYIYAVYVIFSSSDRALFLYTRDYFTSLMELGCVHFTRVRRQ